MSNTAADACCRHKGRPADVRWLGNNLCRACWEMLCDLQERRGRAYVVQFMGLRLARASTHQPAAGRAVESTSEGGS